jgi:hypothetical protein
MPFTHTRWQVNAYRRSPVRMSHLLNYRSYVDQIWYLRWLSSGLLCRVVW